MTVFLIKGPDLVPDLHDLHCIPNLHSHYVPQKHFKVKCVFDGYYETLENEIYGEIDTAVRGERTEQFDVNSAFLCHLNLQNASLLLKDSEIRECALPSQ